MTDITNNKYRELDAEEVFKVLKMIRDIQNHIVQLEKTSNDIHWVYRTKKLDIEFIIKERE
jgi:hypothetical protein